MPIHEQGGIDRPLWLCQAKPKTEPQPQITNITELATKFDLNATISQPPHTATQKFASATATSIKKHHLAPRQNNPDS